MIGFMSKGGILMIPILLCSLVAFAIFVERLFYLYQARKRAKGLDVSLFSLLEQGKEREAIEMARKSVSPLGRIFGAALAAKDVDRETLEAIISNATDRELQEMSAHIQALATIGNIAPLLGLLGTVTGMIKAFMVIQELGGRVDVATLAGGIWEAMLTTAFGLAVALPVIIAHSWLIAEVDKQEAHLQSFSQMLTRQCSQASGELTGR